MMTRYYSLIKTINEILAIHNTHTTWISALPDKGRVEITGKAKGITTKTPITALPCVFWQLETYEQVRIGRSRSWESVKKEYSKERFEIDDGTGKILILPVHIDMVANEVSFPDPSGMVVERYIVSDEEIFLNGNIHQTGPDKYINGDADTPMFITNQNERTALRGLYIRVLQKVGPVLLFVIIFILFLMFQK